MNSLATLLQPHALVLPIVLPLAAGAVLLLLEQSRARGAKRLLAGLSMAATGAWLVLACALFDQARSGAVQAYLLGNWPAPVGIALALDRLSAWMLLITALVALAGLLYALGGGQQSVAQRGRYFHALWQFQLVGLNGAFLTADLFNLFVFFEVLLAASYGLLLHGRGAGQRARLKAGLHCVVFNLCGSALFLLAASMLYALTGTLNMADLALKVALLPAGDARLAQSAACLLLLVFALKAALLPLYFWLPAAYASATAPVAALFAVLTKVGVYAIARVNSLVFSAAGGSTTGFTADLTSPILPSLAMATLVLGALGALAARTLRALVAYLVVVSAGTLLLAVGLGSAQTLSAGLFYMLGSTLVIAAWFLLADRVALVRGGSDQLQPLPLQHGWGSLGVAFFIAAVAVAGVPPLAGFLGKAWLLKAASHTPWAGSVLSVVLGSSLLVMVALVRAGSVLFWASPRAAESASFSKLAPAPAQHTALVGLLAAVVLCAVAAGPISAYTRATAEQLLAREPYIQAVLGARSVPAAFDVRTNTPHPVATP